MSDCKKYPVHRTRDPLADEGIVVQRNPTRPFPVIIVVLIICVTAGFAYFFAETGSIVTPTETVVNVPSPQIDQRLAKLHSVITNKAPEDLEEHLSAYSKVDINEVFHGMTAVMQASTRGDARIVGLLLESGADPNKRGSANRIALQYAAEKNHLEVARLMLEHGADIDGYDNTRLTPLIMAADRGHTDFALLLIDVCADVNIQHVQGWTALIDAARNGNEQLIKKLIAVGADRKAKTSNG